VKRKERGVERKVGCGENIGVDRMGELRLLKLFLLLTEHPTQHSGQRLVRRRLSNVNRQAGPLRPGYDDTKPWRGRCVQVLTTTSTLCGPSVWLVGNRRRAGALLMPSTAPSALSAPVQRRTSGSPRPRIHTRKRAGDVPEHRRRRRTSRARLAADSAAP
jgi:hypothetical protein